MGDGGWAGAVSRIFVVHPLAKRALNQLPKSSVHEPRNRDLVAHCAFKPLKQIPPDSCVACRFSEGTSVECVGWRRVGLGWFRLSSSPARAHWRHELESGVASVGWGNNAWLLRMRHAVRKTNAYVPRVSKTHVFLRAQATSLFLLYVSRHPSSSRRLGGRLVL